MSHLKNISLICTVLIFLSLSVYADSNNGERVCFGRSITVNSDEVVEKVVCIGGSVYVKGKVKTDAVAIGGSVIISGTVGKDVVSIGGSIELKKTAEVNGKVVSIGGSVNKHPDAKINSDIVNLPFFKAFRWIGPFAGFTVKWSLPMLLLFGLIRILLIIALAVLIVLLFPTPINRVVNVLDKNWLKAGGVGLLIAIGTPILMLMLAVTIIGIPLIPFLILLIITAIIFGQVCIAVLIGRKLENALLKKSRSMVSAVLFGEILMGLVCLIPILGILIKVIITFLALGVILLTRFGTCESGKKRKK